MVGFAKAADDEGPRRQAGETGRALVDRVLRGGVEHHVLVDLVADEQDVGGVQNLLQTQHVGPAPHRGAGVVRAVDQDGAGAGRDGGLDLVEVGSEGARRQGHTHYGAAGQFDVGHVAVVAGLQHDHLVARAHYSQDGGDDGLGGTSCDGYFIRRAVLAAMLRFNFGSNCLAQHGHTGHGWVLVQSLFHGLGDGLHQGGVTGEIREALAQVDGVLLGGQGRHHGEDGGAHSGQLGLQGRGADRHVGRRRFRHISHGENPQNQIKRG